MKIQLLVITFLTFNWPLLSQISIEQNKIDIDITSIENIENGSIEKLDLTIKNNIEIPFYNPLYLEKGIIKTVYDKEGVSIITDSINRIRAIEISLSQHPLEKIATLLPKSFFEGDLFFNKNKIEFMTGKKDFESKFKVKQSYKFLDYIYYQFGEYVIRIVYKNNDRFISEFTILLHEKTRNKLGWSHKEIEYEKEKFLNSMGRERVIKYCKERGVDDHHKFIKCCFDEIIKIFEFQKYYFDDFNSKEDKIVFDIMDKCISKEKKK